MTTTSSTAATANAAPRLPLVAFGLSLSLFLAITYLLCVLYGLIVADQGMQQLLSLVLPGFTWITWTSFFLGLVWALAYGWYVALVFTPLFNFFAGRRS